MPRPEDFFKGFNNYSALQDQMRKMTELASPIAKLDKLTQERVFGLTAAIPESVRQVMEGLSPCKEQLDLVRQATTFNRPPEMPEAVRNLLGQASPYAEQLGALRQAVVSGHFAGARLLGEGRHPYGEHFEAVKLATDMQGFASAREAFSRAFGGTNAYTEQLDLVRKAAAFVDASPIQEDLRRAVAGLPSWLRPPDVSDTLLQSWKVTAGIGVIGAAQPGLIHDVIGALHRDRPDTFAFDVAVKLAEGLDLDETLHEDWVLELLRNYAEAIIELLANTKDWLVKQGLYNTLLLILTIVSVYYAREAVIDG